MPVSYTHLDVYKRQLYYHRVIGKENLSGYEDGTMVLICNHGEIYGPVVANLYVPCLLYTSRCV